MRFTLRQLEYFVAAGETCSVTLAAQRINISQPSISSAISHLEAELGVQLFLRHHAQGLSLTPEGQKLLKEARAVLKQVESLAVSAGALANHLAGPIDVGCFVTLAPVVIPQLCHSFMRANGDVEVRVFEGHQETLLNKLRSGDISVALTYDLDITPDVAFEPLAALPPYVLLPAGHPLATREMISLRDLGGEMMILLDLPISRTYFLSMFEHDGIQPHIRTSSQHTEVIRSLVAGGYGYSVLNLMPRNMASLDGLPLAYVPLERRYRPMHLGLASLVEYRKTRLAEAFEEHCRTVISDESIPGMRPLERAPRLPRPDPSSGTATCRPRRGI
jgi:DNA-binding transcriptional LysR family regulator